MHCALRLGFPLIDGTHRPVPGHPRNPRNRRVFSHTRSILDFRASLSFWPARAIHAAKYLEVSQAPSKVGGARRCVSPTTRASVSPWPPCPATRRDLTLESLAGKIRRSGRYAFARAGAVSSWNSPVSLCINAGDQASLSPCIRVSRRRHGTGSDPAGSYKRSLCR